MRDRRDLALLLVLAAVAGALLFSNLDRVYLWQDEAATALLGERLLAHGKPLAWDGKNLITMDSMADEDVATIGARTSDPEAALRYFAARRDFKDDYAWIGQPWGQFVLAGLSLALFGHDTGPARWPFALAAVLTVLVLYEFARSLFSSRLIAALAALLLVSNVYWVLHGRQCRYYALSGLFLLLTVAAWSRWMRGTKHGAWLFGVAAWGWFQIDFGTFWPVVGVLLAAAWLHGKPRRDVLVTGAALLVAVAPFAFYYELFGRVRATGVPFEIKLLGNLFHLNQFAIPVVLTIASAWLFWRRRAALAPVQRALLGASIALVPLMLLWVSAAGPFYFYRYLVPLTPLLALLAAWTLVEAGRSLFPQRPHVASLAAAGMAAAVALSPLPSNLLSWLLPTQELSRHPLGVLLRPELGVLADELLGRRIDPNRAAIEWVRERAGPTDEILVTYEDLPLQFYLPNPVRGGIPAFRVEDRSAEPRFLVLRRSVPFLHWPVFQREIGRHAWQRFELAAPDIVYGNNPDPSWQPAWTPDAPPLVVAERRPPPP